MRLNLTSELKVKTIWISRELPLFNSECLDRLWGSIGPPSEKLSPFAFLESFRCSISRVSIYYAPESDIRVKSLDNLNFSRSTIVQFRESQYIIGLNQTSESKIIVVGICLALWCLIWRISIYYVLESDIRVRTDDLSNFSRASVVQFQASRYIIGQDRTTASKVMVVRIPLALPC